MSDLPEYLKRVNAALALREIPDYPAALEQLKRSAKLAPQDASVFLLLGLTYQDIDELDEAESSLRQSLSFNPQSKEAIQALGLLLSKTGKSREAIDLLKPLFHAEPHNPIISQALVSALVKEGLRAEATDILRTSFDRAPGNQEISIRYARSLEREGQLQRAIETLRQTISLQPSAELYFQLGRLNQEIKSDDEAKESFEKAIKLNQNHELAWWKLADIFVKQGELTVALDTADTGLKALPESTKLLQVKAEILYLKKKKEECLQTYAIAIDLARKQGDINELAIFMFLRDKRLLEFADYKATLTQIDQDILETKQHPLLIYLKIDVLNSRKKYKKIIQVLKNFDYSDSRLNAVHILIPLHFRALIGIGNYEQASSLIAKTLSGFTDEEEKSEFIYNIGNIGIVFYQNGDFEKSRKSFEIVLDVDPENDRVINNLAFLLICEHRWEPALQLLKQAEDLQYGEKATLLTNRAYVILRQGAYESAIQILQNAIEESDIDDDAILHVAYPWQGSLFQGEVDDFPTRYAMVYCSIYANLATAYWMIGDLDKAWQAAQDATEVDSGDSIGYRVMGCLHFSQGEIEQARSLWQKALRLKRSKGEAKILKEWIATIAGDSGL